MQLALPAATVDLQRRTVVRADGTQDRLTALEASLLAYLDRHSARVVSREELLAEVWGYSPSTVSRACDSTVRRLRTKIEVDPAEPESLLTIHGSGYRLIRPSDPPDPSLRVDPDPAATPAATHDAAGRRIPLGDRVLDLDRLTIELPDGSRESLTGNEYQLLTMLADANGSSIDRGRLQRTLWGSAAGRALDNTVARLRRKLEPEPTSPRHLVTTAIGYRLAMGGEPAPSRPMPPPLPTELDARFGRDELVASILDRYREGDVLVTLIGPGGVGKSRVALAVADRWSAEPDGLAWWVDCAEAHTLEAWCVAIGRALRIPVSSGDPVEAVSTALGSLGHRALVVLDNLEQLAEHVPVIGRWLRDAPGVRILATSRLLLQLTGERRIVVDPLGLDDAVALFLDRAERPPRPDELDDVRGLAEDLEGLPLAIELAAARTRVLSVAELRARTSDRLKLLGGGDRDRPQRYRSVRASLDASWELLTEWARAALSQLTVFRGGFGMEAAEAVVELERWPDAPWVVDVVQELVDASLLRIGDDGRRFAMLQVIADYASECLDPADRHRARIRHARWFGRFAATFGEFDGPSEVEIRGAVVRELDNLVAAARFAAEEPQAVEGAEAGPVAWEALELVGPMRVGAEICEALRWTPGLSAQTRARLALAAGRARHPLGEWDRAVEHLTDAVALAREAADRRLEGRAWAELAAAHQSRNHSDEMEEPARTARRIATDSGDRLLEARALVVLSQWHRMQRRTDDAVGDGSRAVSLAAQLGARRVEALARCHLAIAHREARDLDASAAELEWARLAAADSGDERLVAVIRFQLGGIESMRGRLSASRASFEEARAAFRRIGDQRNELYSQRVLAEEAHRAGRYDEARAGFEEVLQRADALGWDDLRRQTMVVLSQLLDRMGFPGEAEAMLVAVRPQLEAAGDLHSEGVALNNLGKLLRRQRRFAEAEQVLDRSMEIHRRLGDRFAQGSTMNALALLLHEKGDLDAARATYVAAAAMNAESGNGRGEASSHLHLGRLEVGFERWADAEVELGLAERILFGLAERTGSMIGNTWLWRARVAQAEGRLDDARALLQAAEGACPVDDLAAVHAELAAALRS